MTKEQLFEQTLNEPIHPNSENDNNFYPKSENAPISAPTSEEQRKLFEKILAENNE